MKIGSKGVLIDNTADLTYQYGQANFRIEDDRALVPHHAWSLKNPDNHIGVFRPFTPQYGH